MKKNINKKDKMTKKLINLLEDVRNEYDIQSENFSSREKLSEISESFNTKLSSLADLFGVQTAISFERLFVYLLNKSEVIKNGFDLKFKNDKIIFNEKKGIKVLDLQMLNSLVNYSISSSNRTLFPIELVDEILIITNKIISFADDSLNYIGKFKNNLMNSQEDLFEILRKDKGLDKLIELLKSVDKVYDVYEERLTIYLYLSENLYLNFYLGNFFTSRGKDYKFKPYKDLGFRLNFSLDENSEFCEFPKETLEKLNEIF